MLASARTRGIQPEFERYRASGDCVLNAGRCRHELPNQPTFLPFRPSPDPGRYPRCDPHAPRGPGCRPRCGWRGPLTRRPAQANQPVPAGLTATPQISERKKKPPCAAALVPHTVRFRKERESKADQTWPAGTQERLGANSSSLTEPPRERSRTRHTPGRWWSSSFQLAAAAAAFCFVTLHHKPRNSVAAQ